MVNDQKFAKEEADFSTTSQYLAGIFFFLTANGVFRFGVINAENAFVYIAYSYTSWIHFSFVPIFFEIPRCSGYRDMQRKPELVLFRVANEDWQRAILCCQAAPSILIRSQSVSKQSHVYTLLSPSPNLSLKSATFSVRPSANTNNPDA